MRPKIFFLTFLLFFCFFSSLSASSSPPDTDQVIAKWERVKKEMKQEVVYSPFTHWQHWVARLLEHAPPGVSFFLALFFLSSLLFLIFLAFIRLTPYYQKDTDTAREQKGWGTAGSDLHREFLHLYNQARDNAEQGFYSQAVLRLHKASILFLTLKKILLANKEYTNKEINQLLSHQKYSHAFRIIAGHSEVVAFKGENIEEEVFHNVLNLFKEDYEVT